MFKYFEPNKIFSVTSRAPKYVLFLNTHTKPNGNSKSKIFNWRYSQT